VTSRPGRSGGWIVERAVLVCGAIGLVAGFLRGLTVYAPTAWAAAFEVGIPAALAGALLGLAVAGIRALARWVSAESR
jgi:hypothetical protein